MIKQEFVSMQDKAVGAILGFATGDALGVPGEFRSREELDAEPVRDMCGGGSHRQPAGTWSDDTSMVLCTMDSLMEKGIDYRDQMLRFGDWLWNASNTAHDEVFDVGCTTKNAIISFSRGVPPLDCGETAEFSCGNGSLMRILPTALYFMGQDQAPELNDRTAPVIHNISKCTHAHPRCLMACGIYCAAAFQLYRGNDLPSAVKSGILSALSYYEEESEFADVYREFESLKSIDLRTKKQIHGSGYVLHTLEASLWCLLKTASYEDCVLTAISLGEDTDTTAAVAGGLAGLWYGVQAIPEKWLQKLAKCRELKQRAEKFYCACFKNS